MKVLTRHLSVSFLRGFALVALVLAALFSVMELVGQLDDVGKGAYGLRDAFAYVGLTLPRRVIGLAPVCSLLGSLVAVGILADGSELLAMRASGVSAWQICRSVLLGAGVVMALGLFAGEYLAPPLEQEARTRRALAIADRGLMLTRGGFWARDGDRLILVRQMGSDGSPLDVDLYERGEDGLLTRYRRAERGEIQEGSWRLEGVREHRVDDDGLVTRSTPGEIELGGEFLSRDQARVLGVPPETHSVASLWAYVRTLRDRGENAGPYALALWQRVSEPVATGAMVLLSLPLLFGLPRSRSAGARVLVGAIAGVGFHLANQIAGYLSLLVHAPPALAALGPSVAVSALALWWIARIP